MQRRQLPPSIALQQGTAHSAFLGRASASCGSCRSFASSTGTSNDREDATAFVIARGYSPEVAAAVVGALAAPGSGLPQGSLLPMVTQLAGRWEVGEDAGLVALVKSVEQELARDSGKQLVSFFVQPSNGSQAFECEAFEGMSLKDVAEYGTGPGANMLAEILECACSGVMACSTCHVYVDPAWFDQVGGPSEAELDMIELAHEPRDTSRLGCQLRFSHKFQGLRLTIPSGANNLFDDIPFE